MDSLKIIWDAIKDGSIHEMWEEFKWMFSYGKNYKKEIIFYTILGLINTGTSLLSINISYELLRIVTHADTNGIPFLVGMAVFSSLFSLTIGQYMSRLTLKINIRIQNEIQADIFDKIIAINWMDLTKYHAGDILNRFSSDVSTVASAAIGWIPDIIVGVIRLIVILCYVLYLDPALTILTIISVPITALSYKLMLKKMRQYNEKVKIMNSEVTAFQSETFYNMDSIKSFGLTSLFSRKLKYWQQEFKDVSLEYNWWSIKMNTVLSLVSLLTGGLFSAWLYYKLFKGFIDYAEMNRFIQLSSYLKSSVSSVVSIIPSTVTSTISAKRLMEIINQPKEEEVEDEINHLYDLQEKGFSVELEDVLFAYTENKHVLVNSSMDANPGEIIALVGPSGEGKTTLIRMFLGLIHPESGKARLKDANGEYYTLDASTRKLFAYVPQGNTIFSGTIADNLRMVKEDATDEQIIEALKSACAYDFVEKLDEGINSKIGARGRGLSEGQAQRISIARAILRDAPILLLDEATSALDIETERKVLRNIIQNHPNKTCIVTTHRPSVLNMCQRVYRVVDTKLTQLTEEEASAMAKDF